MMMRGCACRTSKRMMGNRYDVNTIDSDDCGVHLVLDALGRFWESVVGALIHRHARN